MWLSALDGERLAQERNEEEPDSVHEVFAERLVAPMLDFAARDITYLFVT
jgi:hypothetical protein